MTDSRAIKSDPPGYIDEVLADYAQARVAPNTRVLLEKAVQAAELTDTLSREARQLTAQVTALNDMVRIIKDKAFALGSLIKTLDQALGRPDSLRGLWEQVTHEQLPQWLQERSPDLLKK